MPKLFDIHSHINFSAFKKDGDEVIKRTLNNGVSTILVGSQYDTSKRAVEYAEKYSEGVYPNTKTSQNSGKNVNNIFSTNSSETPRDLNYSVGVYAAIGLHPFHIIEQEIKSGDWEIETAKNTSVPPMFFKTRPEKFGEQKYLELAKSQKVVAIGECGLDYYHIPLLRPIKKQDSEGKAENFNISEVKNLQIETFEQQIELALKLNLPVMIHCREAHDEIIKILKKYKSQAGDKLRGDIHFFTGNYEQSKQYFDLDFSISFTGVITFTNDYRETIKKSPLERIMIETDSPYVAPAPYRGKRNEPIYVKEVCCRIAEIKNISFEEVAKETTQNAIKMFLKN